MQRTRIALLAAAAFVGAWLLPATASADTWPSRPIRWVVPFPPGGAMDAIARTLAEKATHSLGQPVVVDNKPGAGGNIGADLVAKSPGDGYTMMITSIGMATNRALYQKLSYDPVKDFAPVSLLAVVPNVLVTNAAHNSVKTVPEVIALAKAQPGRITYASAGNGTSIHLAGELFTSLAQVEMQHVPYRGSGPAVTDLISGQVNIMFDSITSARPHIQSGKLRAIAVTTAKRSPSLPNVPTVAEAGLPGYEVAPWFAVFVPAATPAPIVQRLNAVLLDAMKQPDVKAKFETIGAEAIGSTPQELAAHLQRETTRWGRLIADRNIKPD